MRLEIRNNGNSPYISIVENLSVEDPKTHKRVSRKKIVKAIGPVSRFDDHKPDFIQRVKDSYEAGAPIIPELLPYVKKDIEKEVYDIRLYEGTDDCVSHPKLIANLLLEKILSELDLDQLIRSYKNIYRHNFDVYGYFKALLFGRILNPASKIATVKQNEDYYTPIIKNSTDDYNVYEALDFIYEHRKALFNRIDTAMTEKYGRTTSYIYYDVTNFFFYSDIPDEDSDDEKGLRKVGVSKEERKLPIVQMGLLMDEQGIPISIEVFPGNTLDHLTLKSAFENSVNSIGDNNSRYIFVCDKGIGICGNPGFAVAKGNGYLSSKSVRKATKEEKEWILDQDAYTIVSENFKYKSRIVKKKYTTPEGNEIEATEKIVTYWSRSFYEREKAEKRSFYELLGKLIDSPNSFRVSKTQIALLKKFLKKTFIETGSGELIDSAKLKAQLDMDKLKKDYELMGYYSIITSETNMEDLTIIDTYKNLVQIEDEFRVMKSTLDTRPMWVRTKEHIIAHLTVCTIALQVIRLIQRQINIANSRSKQPKNLCSCGLPADRIQAALNKWTVEKIGEVYYRFSGIDDEDLKLILDSFGINIPKKLYKLAELKGMKTDIELLK